MYLYVKTHNKSGLKYLGKTIQNPFKYKGSGTYWLRHIKKYGNDVTTEILLETDDKELIKEKGMYYSELWQVVNSPDWANLIPEQGDGGDTSKSLKYIQSMKNKDITGQKNPFYGRHHTEKTKRKIKEANKGMNKGVPKSDKTKQLMSQNNARYWKGKSTWNKGKIGLQKQGIDQILKKSKPLIFDEIPYISLKAAEKSTGISVYKIKKSCKFISIEEYRFIATSK